VPLAVTGEDLLTRVLDDETVAALAAQARGQGVALLGEGGLLQQLTKRFLEAALDGEMDAHLGRGRHERTGVPGGNARNGAHLAEVYGTTVSKETISTITDRVLDTFGEWQNRPLDSVYP
jgi:putative transposase